MSLVPSSASIRSVVSPDAWRRLRMAVRPSPATSTMPPMRAAVRGEAAAATHNTNGTCGEDKAWRGVVRVSQRA